jgi:choline dehydrogenase
VSNIADPHPMTGAFVMACRQYGLFRSGPVASSVVEGGLFGYSGEDRSMPDLQFHFRAGASAEDGVPGAAPGHSGITLDCYGLQPKLRGTVRHASGDPSQPPTPG